MTDVAMGYSTAEQEIADLREQLNRALDDSSIAEAGRLEALRERDGYQAALEKIGDLHTTAWMPRVDYQTGTVEHSPDCAGCIATAALGAGSEA